MPHVAKRNHIQYKYDIPGLPRYLRDSSGYAMYLVLIVLSIIGILGYITFTNQGETRMLAARELKKLQTSLLAESGLAKAEYFLNGGDPKGILWETTGMDDSIRGNGEIHLEAMRFGGFTKITSIGARNKFSCTIQGLAGRELPGNLSPVLTLAGGIPGLVLDDVSLINGTVVIHGGYVGRGKNKQRITGSEKWVRVMNSPKLPFDVTPILQLMDSLSAGRIALLSQSQAIRGDVTINPSNDTLLGRDTLVVVGNCSILGVSVTDKTIACAGYLSVDGNAQCAGSAFSAESLTVGACSTDECLFCSDRNLTVAAGHHNSQFLSTDTIFVKKAATFDNLSAWISFRTLKPDTLKSGGVVFERGGTYAGCCVSFTDSTEKPKRSEDLPAVNLGQNSTFNGCIITDGNANIDSTKITGHVWAGLLKTTGPNNVQYINYLFATRLGAPKTELPFLLVRQNDGEKSIKLAFWERKRNYK